VRVQREGPTGPSLVVAGGLDGCSSRKFSASEVKAGWCGDLVDGHNRYVADRAAGVFDLPSNLKTSLVCWSTWQFAGKRV